MIFCPFLFIWNIFLLDLSFSALQAISYTTGVPAMIGAMMIMTGTWKKAGVYNIEEFDPDPFMEALNKWGLPWEEDFDPTLVD